MDEFLAPLLLSLKLAAVVTVILFVLSVPLAYYLAYTKSKMKPVFEAISAMPIVLPPTVIGFYLLVLLSEKSYFGGILLETFDISLLFSFEGLVIASCFYSLPFMVQPLQAGFENINSSVLDAAKIISPSRSRAVVDILLPNIKPNIVTALIITFAHTIGEFGVILMVGGNIPGETRVASLAIYDAVENLDFQRAHHYALILVVVSFLVLFSVYILNKRTTANFS